jgi:hypothetical protein
VFLFRVSHLFHQVERRSADEVSTSIRLATVDEVLSARAYMCFVSPFPSLIDGADE